MPRWEGNPRTFAINGSGRAQLLHRVMQEVAARQLQLLDRLSLQDGPHLAHQQAGPHQDKWSLQDCSHLASDGSKGPRAFSTPQPPPFGTGTTRSGSQVWSGNAFGRRRTGEPQPLVALASSSQQANASGRQQRPASARASGPSLSPAHLLALRREVTAIRRTKELQAQGALQKRGATARSTAEEAPAPRWLYALDGEAVDDLI
jgi:hypothetical protein